MKVLVTGGNGFIGKHVRTALEDAGHEPIVFDREFPPFMLQHIRFLGDVRDRTSVTEAAAHADVIIHLAAVLGTQETISNAYPAVETNILGTLNVLAAAKQYDIPVAYAAVGNHWMRHQGGGGYTITKTCAEDLCYMFNDNLGGLVQVVRPMNAYGPGQSVCAPWGSSKVRKIMPTFIHQALTGHPIEVYGDGSQISDMVWVQDVADVFVMAIERLEAGHKPADAWEVGPIRHTSVLEIATAVRDEVEMQTGSTSPITFLPMRPGEVPGQTIAHSGGLEAAGYDRHKMVPLQEGIALTVAYYRDRLGV
jgi:UDP-glucose 4-epimerase